MKGLIVLLCALAAGCAKKPAQTLKVSPESAPQTVQTAPPETTAPATHRTDWRLLLVNPWNPLPEDFQVELRELEGGFSVDERIYDDLQQLLGDARRVGMELVVCSAYRTLEQQQWLYDARVERAAAEGFPEPSVEAGRWVAKPNTSEHQTGLALDITAAQYRCLTEDQAQTPEQRWLMDNAWRYGFILRYPQDKCAITGIGYEPWHYRYVGKAAAQEMTRLGLCLEEYLGEAGPEA